MVTKKKRRMGNRLDSISIVFTVNGADGIRKPVLTLPLMDQLTITLVPFLGQRPAAFSFHTMTELAANTLHKLCNQVDKLFIVTKVEYVQEMFGKARAQKTYCAKVFVKFHTMASLELFFAVSRLRPTASLNKQTNETLELQADVDGYGFTIQKNYDASTTLLTHLPVVPLGNSVRNSSLALAGKLGAELKKTSTRKNISNLLQLGKTLVTQSVTSPSPSSSSLSESESESETDG